MDIGSWGDLVFEVSGWKVLTFSELTQESSGRWAEHEAINSAPLSEFLGPGLDRVSLKIIFSRMLGVDPRESYEMLREHVRKGENFPLILGGAPLSMNMWRVENLSSVAETFAGQTGDVLQSEITITFKEYN